ncbi:ABC transporter permease [uncultured Paludibaculum sp.]|uniref:ABC transporter permease n=1 Tax=uncultured Paludibaculum sp. TaxID=1765020 RepID=UPI002AAC1155|nr:ABC transporter permease [uncultured Paludibaculum sp.]
MLSKLIRRVRYLFQQDDRDRSLAEEIRSHLDLHTEELVNQGLQPEAAEYTARRHFGNATLVREDARAVWIARWFDEIVQDSKYAFRSLRRQPGFTAVAVLSATLGIGACCTIFGIANFALSPTLHNVAQPESLVSIFQTDKGEPGSTFSYPDLTALRERQRSFTAVGAMFPFVPANFGSGPGARREWGWLVTANYFDILGTRPCLGRTFAAGEDVPGAPPAIIVSYNLWRDRLGGDVSAVGREILFNGHQARLIGVAPAGFRGHEVALTADFWVPLSMLDRIPFPMGGFDVLKDRGSPWFWPVARLRPGLSIGQASADLGILAGQLRAEHPKRWKDRGFHIERAGQLYVAVRRIFSVFFRMLLGVALLALLIACSNIANLLLARGSSRQREIATRLAIGAGRGRLIRQLVTESLILSLLGGVGGLVVAFYGGQMIGRFRLPVSLPIDFTVTLDRNVALFAAVLSVVTGILFGLAPALQATRHDLASTLKAPTSTPSGLRRFGLRNILIVTQVAISAVLLIASSLFLRSLTTARTMDLGMSARDVLFLQIDPAANGYGPTQTRQFFETLANRVSAVPGVRAASYTNLLPLSFITANGLFTTDEQRSDPRATPIDSQAVVIGPKYFETLGIQLLRGRDFGPERPDGEAVVIVNEAFARKAFPGQDPMGRRVYRNSKPFRIVGVAATSKVRTIGEDPEPQVFHAFSQMMKKEDMPMGLTLAVRTNGDPLAWLPAMKEQIASLDRSLPIFDVRTMNSHLRGALLLPRLAALMFGLAGTIGLVIASVGLYGIVSFTVARRTREIGIRMAIGAQRSEVLGMVLRQGMGVTSIGVMVGVLAALPAMRLASSLLYGVAPSDPLTFLMVPMCLLVVAIFSSLTPAYRAAHLDPIATLKHE